jgi:nitrogen fixation/metabolism regulation signal transduction histidine kinase
MYNPEIAYFYNEMKEDLARQQEEAEKNKKPRKTRKKVADIV